VAGGRLSRILTDEVIALLNEKFVPYPATWEAPGQASDWWKTVSKDNFANNAEKLKERTVPGTTLWTITSVGATVPAAQASNKEGLANALRQVLELYAKLSESERRPAKPIEDTNTPMPAPPPGGLVLNINDIALLRPGPVPSALARTPYDAKAPHEATDQYRSAAGIYAVPGPQRQSLWLTEAECKSLMPQNPQKGSTFAVPALLTKRICLFGLRSATCWHVEHFWDPDSVRVGDLKLTVEEVAASSVRMGMHGSVLLVKKSRLHTQSNEKPPIVPPPDLEDRYDAQVEGVVVYDTAQKKLTRWDMVVLGEHTGAFWPAINHSKPSKNFTLEPVVIGFSFELDRSDVSAEQRRQAPYILAHTFKGEKRQEYYWNPDKWEEDWKKQQRR
jgi:hypothetical protein